MEPVAEDEQRQRFLVELEFVQCLANPNYLDWLATEVSSFSSFAAVFALGGRRARGPDSLAYFVAEFVQGYLLDGKFIRYLDYLQYWKQPQYAKFLVYPHCLRFLDLLQHEDIRKELTKDRNLPRQLADQQYYHWLYRRRHTVHIEPAEGAAAGAQPQPASGK